MTTSDVASPAVPLVLDEAAIAAMPWVPMSQVGRAVRHRVLWRSGPSEAGVMRIEPGGCLDAHAHREAHHHMWVLDGAATMAGRRLTAGSYAHVPAGVEHGMEEVDTGGITFVYLYLHPDQ